MFVDFLFHLRAHGLKVSITEWMALTEALARGHARASLTRFYHLARALLIKRETAYDTFDRCFASYFEGLTDGFDLSEEVMRWLENPVLPRELSPEEIAALSTWDLETLKAELEKRLREQKERHDGGSYWVGTGGTSPFGHGGFNPQGTRVGGSGGGRSAVHVAGERRFQNLRSDRVLDTRDLGTALRRLRRLSKLVGALELDLDETIDKSARDGGEIDLVFRPPKKNRVKLLLLLDVGGSMDPHAALTERLFSAAHQATHWKKFQHYFFHNCVYEKLYTDMTAFRGPRTEEVLKTLDETWTVVVVGDAWMSPYELTHQWGSAYYGQNHEGTGLQQLRRLREKCPSSVWLNPEPRRIWDAPTIAQIRTVFPMFELTLDGLTQAVDVLRGAKPNRPSLERVG